MAPSGSGVSVTGSDVYRIDAAGNPQSIWSHAQDMIYAIAFDAQGRALLGSGNKGYIYRIESDVLYTALVTAPSTQITAFQDRPGRRALRRHGNVGKIYQMGPGLAQEGSLESDVFDAGFFSQWGRLSFEANLNGGQRRHCRAQRKPRPAAEELEPVVGGHHRSRRAIALAAPPARFIQWKATLTAAGAQSPELESVDVAYLQRNVAPRIEAIEITPPNYKFPSAADSADRLRKR